MPNDISNRLRLLCDESTAEEIWQLISNGDRLIDFNLILPIPADIPEGEEYKKWKDENWGCSRNSYDCVRIKKESGDPDIFEIYFESAWDTPHGVFRKLAEMFPRVAFQVFYASEDRGHNCGIMTYANGEKVNDTEVWGPAAVKMWFDITGRDRKEYNYNEKYEYVDPYPF